MSDYEKELEAFLIKVGQIQPAATAPKPATKKDEE
jgi:hypothetical protein